MATNKTLPDTNSLPLIQGFQDKVKQYAEFLDDNHSGEGLLWSMEHLTHFLTPAEGSKTAVFSRANLQNYVTKSGDIPLLRKASSISGFSDLTRDLLAAWSAAHEVNPKLNPLLSIELDDVACRDSHTIYPIRLLISHLNNNRVTAECQSRSEIDHDYGMHLFLSREFDLMKFYTPQEKAEFMPFRKGSIVVMYSKRGSLTNNSPWGSIQSQYLGMITNVDKKNHTISIKNLNITCTEETNFVDFLRIDGDVRFKFRDLLKNQEPGHSETFNLSDVGFNYCMYNEPWLITNLSRSSDLIPSYVTYRGRISRIDMTEIDTLYWCLKQRGIEFDEKLFFEENPQVDLQTMAWNVTGEKIPEELLRLAKAQHLNSEEQEILEDLELQFEQDDDEDFV